MNFTALRVSAVVSTTAKPVFYLFVPLFGDRRESDKAPKNVGFPGSFHSFLPTGSFAYEAVALTN
jgi:hypothetical protein